MDHESSTVGVEPAPDPTRAFCPCGRPRLVRLFPRGRYGFGEGGEVSDGDGPRLRPTGFDPQEQEACGLWLHETADSPWSRTWALIVRGVWPPREGTKVASVRAGPVAAVPAALLAVGPALGLTGVVTLAVLVVALLVLPALAVLVVALLVA